MTDVEIGDAQPDELEHWDQFIGTESVNGTLFHERRFLSYHRNRFRAHERFLVIRRAGRTIGQIALGMFREDGFRLARSPYGGSFGGIVLAAPPGPATAREVARRFVGYLRQEGVDRASLTQPSAFFAKAPGMDALTQALLEHGFRMVNRDITSATDLSGPASVAQTVTARARRMARKAELAGIEVSHGAALADYWPLMDMTFARHGASPTHSQAQLADLMTLYPDRISLSLAWLEGRAVAGICSFRANARVMMTFYLCTDPEFRHLQGLTLLAMTVLEEARRQGCLWLDFGTSSVAMQARPGVFEFKENFGSVGFFRETLEWTA